MQALFRSIGVVKGEQNGRAAVLAANASHKAVSADVSCGVIVGFSVVGGYFMVFVNATRPPKWRPCCDTERGYCGEA